MYIYIHACARISITYKIHVKHTHIYEHILYMCKKETEERHTKSLYTYI